MSEDGESRLRIGIERVLNPEVVTFNTNRKISNKAVAMLEFPVASRHDDYLREVGLVGGSIIRRPGEIEGLEQMWIHPYKLVIKKARMFDWEGLTPQIVAVLKDVLQDPDAEVQTLPEMITQVTELVIRHFACHLDGEVETPSDEPKKPAN